MYMLKRLQNLCCLKETAIKAAFRALVVKGLGECLRGGSFLGMFLAFSSAFTFAGERAPSRLYGGFDCKCGTAILLNTY